MIKKLFFTLFLLLLIFLTGCDVDKTISIPNTQPETLFLNALSIIKKEIPSAKIDVDLQSKNISYTNNTNENYPDNINLSFLKNGLNTNILITAKETNENKLKNLQELLVNSYNQYKQNIEKETLNNLLPQPIRRIDSI